MAPARTYSLVYLIYSNSIQDKELVKTYLLSVMFCISYLLSKIAYILAYIFINLAIIAHNAFNKWQLFYIYRQAINTPECSLYKAVEPPKTLLPYYFTFNAMKAVLRSFLRLSKKTAYGGSGYA